MGAIGSRLCFFRNRIQKSGAEVQKLKTEGDSEYYSHNPSFSHMESM